MRIHISELQQYMRCPKSYRLRVIDGIEPAKKSLTSCKAAAVRKIISRLHKSEEELIDFSQEEVEAVCEEVWQIEVSDPAVDREELESIAIQGKPATKKRPAVPAISKDEKLLGDIKNWCFQYSRSEFDSDLLYTDVHFRDIIGDVEFTGSIDQIRRHPDLGIQLIVFNTSSQPPNGIYLERDFALSLYVHAAWQGELYPGEDSEAVHLRTIPSIYCYYVPHLEYYQRKTKNREKGDRKGNPMIHVYRSEKALLQFEYEILYTVSGIEHGFYPMMPVAPCGCALCPYSYRCGGTAEAQYDKKETAVAEEVA